MIWASRNGRLNVVNALLDAEADVNAENDNGRTALYLAVQNDHGEIALALRDAGATDLYAKDENNPDEIYRVTSRYRKNFYDKLINRARGKNKESGEVELLF